ncbi:MAG: class I SAM-dependent rRNA methyltransferase [Deltaproteobacteria bacterium]|nr:class I SAM-dependent rRNA methyltransferase [Deltaproteobacteria bacterium]
MVEWRLHKRGERRFRQGHPWVFSNELVHPPAGIVPGAPVDLCDARGAFLACGYGNPHSLIAFRQMTRDRTQPVDLPLVRERLRQASHFRRRLGYHATSHRVVFAEGDLLPGLIIDRYVNAAGQVFVAELSTAGMERLVGETLPTLLHELADWEVAQGGAPFSRDATTVVVRREGAFRALEGLAGQPAHVVGPLASEALSAYPARVASGQGSLTLIVDLFAGQKTGLFLDQRENIAHLLRLLQARRSSVGEEFRVLDLFAYVGQWSAHVAQLLEARSGVTATLADASAAALATAATNVSACGARSHPVQLDLLQPWPKALGFAYDLVVCDPPALIKNRRDIAAGYRAYVKCNAWAMQRLRPGGLFVTCSCSHHLSHDAFREAVTAAMHKAKVSLQWVYCGSQAADHPRRLEFPEGEYLQCSIGERQP